MIQQRKKLMKEPALVRKNKLKEAAVLAVFWISVILFIYVSA